MILEVPEELFEKARVLCKAIKEKEQALGIKNKFVNSIAKKCTVVLRDLLNRGDAPEFAIAFYSNPTLIPVLPNTLFIILKKKDILFIKRY